MSEYPKHLSTKTMEKAMEWFETSKYLYTAAKPNLLAAARTLDQEKVIEAIDFEKTRFMNHVASNADPNADRELLATYVNEYTSRIDQCAHMALIRQVWSQSRTVYRMEADVLHAICSTKLDSIPTSVVSHLPKNMFLIQSDGIPEMLDPINAKSETHTSYQDAMLVYVTPSASENDIYYLHLVRFARNAPHIWDDECPIADPMAFSMAMPTDMPSAGQMLSKMFDVMEPPKEADVDIDRTRRITRKCMEIAFNVMAYITYQPEDIVYVSEPRKKRPRRSQRNKTQLSTYIVGETIVRNFIRQRTRYENAPQDDGEHGHHRTARPHVVSAYWRKQHYGPKNSLTKMIWVPSFMRCVNSDEDVEQIPLTVVNVKG